MHNAKFTTFIQEAASRINLLLHYLFIQEAAFKNEDSIYNVLKTSALGSLIQREESEPFGTSRCKRGKSLLHKTQN